MAQKFNAAISALVEQVALLKGNRFASLTYRAKESGELARHTIQLGFSYQNAVEKSLAEIAAIKFDDVRKGSRHTDSEFTRADFDAAKGELVESFRKTLAAHAVGKQNADYTKKDTYISLFNGLNVSKTDGSFKLFGLSVNKVVIENGVFKTVNSSGKTLAKKAISRLLPVGKFREYAIDENTLAQAKLNGETIEI